MPPTTCKYTSRSQSVQLHDIVVIDWIGCYCNDTTKRLLNIPTSSTTTTTSSSSEMQQSSDDETDNHHQDSTSSPSSSSSAGSVPLKSLDALPIFHSVENYCCCIGDQDIIPAVEMGLRFMNMNVVEMTPVNCPDSAVDNNTNTNDDDAAAKTFTPTTRHKHATDPDDTNQTITTVPTVALIYSHSKYAYGMSSRTYTYSTATTDGIHHTTTYTLPPLSNVLYRVTLKRIISSPNDMPSDPKLVLQLYQCKKLLANDIYQNDIRAKSKHSNTIESNNNSNKNIDTIDTNATITADNSDFSSTNMYHLHRAIRIYQRTVDKLENFIIGLKEQQSDDNDQTNDIDASRTPSYIDEAKQLQIDCLNNISAVYMKCHMYHKAKEACVQTLLKDSNNSKALSSKGPET